MNNLKKLFNPRRASVFTLVMWLTFGNIPDGLSQTKTNSNDLIILSGNITCEDPVKGPLQDVHVFNKNKNLGTLSDENGNFKIEMGKNDTILFSTIQHVENSYILSDDHSFTDHSVDILMYQDTVWLDAVTIYGYLRMEEFKKEILSLDLPRDDISIAMPILDRYANQRATGQGKTILYGPLTTLLNKINRIAGWKIQGYTKSKK